MLLRYKQIPIYIILLLTFQADFVYGEKDPKTKPKPKKITFSIEKLSQNVKTLNDDKEWYKEIEKTRNPVNKWKTTISLMRNGTLNKEQTIDSVKDFCERMNNFIKIMGFKTYTDYEWVFPVKGYTSAAIGGINGSGFNPNGFSFYDMNSSGHPAHDIFINDKDQDCNDDVTGKPVDILSMSSGMVVEIRDNWTSEMMDLRGGNFVYVYDNYSNGFFYYAHLKDVTVNVGDFVKPGSVLGTMGRTGTNAYPKRSPTHLHIMYVRSNDGELIPENIYNMLLEAKVVY